MEIPIPLSELTTEQMVRLMFRKMMTMEVQMASIKEALEEQGAEIGRVSDAVNNKVGELEQKLRDALEAWENSEAELVQQHLLEAQETAEGIRANTTALGQILALADPEDDSADGDDPTEDPSDSVSDREPEDGGPAVDIGDDEDDVPVEPVGEEE